MNRTRTAAAVASACLLLTPLAGCGGDDKVAAPTASPTQNANQAFVDGLLAAMKAKSTARIELNLGGAITGTGEVRYGDTTDLEFTAKVGSQQFTVVLVAGSAYVRQSADGKFVKVTKDDPVMGSFIGQLAFAGPREALQALSSGIKNVEKDGTTTEKGVVLTRYRVTIDAKVAADAFGAGGDVTDTTSAETLQFYVDAANLVRRVQGTISGQQITMSISDWGKPVTIKAPSGDQVLNKQ